MLFSAASIAAESSDGDPLIRAKLRGVEHRKNGSSRSSEEVCPSSKCPNSSASAAKRWISGEARNQLIGLIQGKRGYAYPAFQFEDGKDARWPERSSGCAQWARSVDAVDFFFFANGKRQAQPQNPHSMRSVGERLKQWFGRPEAYGEQGAA